MGNHMPKLHAAGGRAWAGKDTHLKHTSVPPPDDHCSASMGLCMLPSVEQPYWQNYGLVILLYAGYRSSTALAPAAFPSCPNTLSPHTPTPVLCF
jgi:hypothetical protein